MVADPCECPGLAVGAFEGIEDEGREEAGLAGFDDAPAAIGEDDAFAFEAGEHEGAVLVGAEDLEGRLGAHDADVADVVEVEKLADSALCEPFAGV